MIMSFCIFKGEIAMRRKTIISILLFLIGIFALNGEVYAEVDCEKYACATCTYTLGQFTATYDIQSDGMGDLTVNFSGGLNYSGAHAPSVVNGVFDSDYWKDFSNNQVVCKDIYLVSGMSGGGSQYTFSTTGNENQKMTLSSSTNNHLTFIDNSHEYNSCDFTDRNINVTCTVQYLDGNISKVECGNFHFNERLSDLDGIDFSGQCSNIRLSLTCNISQRYCALTRNIGGGVTGSQTGGTSPTPTPSPSPSQSPDTGDESINETCEGLLGPNLMDDISLIFTWIRILVPIILIIMGSIDFARAVLSDDQQELKKATSRFVKRCIIAVAIFFIPSIIMYIISFIDKIADASCDIRVW